MTWPRSLLVELMESAVGHALDHVQAGGLPFVGVVVDADGHVSEFGVNRVHETGDPTAHAEIVAMREVQAETGRSDLSGAVLLATGEPCGLCYRFAMQCRIERIYVAVDATTVAQWGFDYRGSYRSSGVDPQRRAEMSRELFVPGALEPFERFAWRHGLDVVESGFTPRTPPLNRTEHTPWNGSTLR